MNRDDLCLALPLLVPLSTALVCVLAGRRPQWQRWLGVIGAAAHLSAAVWLLRCVVDQEVLVSQIGGWPAPFGVTFVADRLSAAMVFMAALVGLLGSAFAIPDLRGQAISHFMRLLQFMLAGCSGLFLTGDLFNFYVWFELILIASFGLMTLGNRRAQLEATTKYLAMNIVGSLLLLTGVGLLYALTGTLNMADLAQRLDARADSGLTTAIAVLVLLALGIKSGAFPLFFWLPASYHAPPIAVTAIFGGLLTKVGVYGLLRLFTLVFVQDVQYTHTLILVLGGFTMVTGVLGAVAQHDLRRLLSFHIISQIGYMLMGLGFFTVAGVGAAIFFVLHIIVTKTALFFVTGLVRRESGSFDLEKIGGLYRRRPVLAALFILPALSLAGIPPLSGFVGKLFLIQVGLQIHQYVIVVVSLAVGLLTLYSMVKIWTLGFWSPAEQWRPPRAESRRAKGLGMAPAGVLALLALALGLGGRPLLEFVSRAAHTLLERETYIHAVLAGVSS